MQLLRNLIRKIPTIIHKQLWFLYLSLSKLMVMDFVSDGSLIHPNVDLVNEPVRPRLFTRSRYLRNRGLLNRGSGVHSNFTNNQIL